MIHNLPKRTKSIDTKGALMNIYQITKQSQLQQLNLQELDALNEAVFDERELLWENTWINGEFTELTEDQREREKHLVKLDQMIIIELNRRNVVIKLEVSKFAHSKGE